MALESCCCLTERDFDGTPLMSSGTRDPLLLKAKTVPEFMIFEVRKAMNRFVDFESVNNMMYVGMGLVRKIMWIAAAPLVRYSSMASAASWTGFITHGTSGLFCSQLNRHA